MKPTEEKVLNYIKKYHEEHSLMPTVREICKGLGFKSTSSVAYHLTHLVEKGKLTNMPNKSRAYRLANDNTLSFNAKWHRLKEWLEEEKEEVDVLIDPCAEEYEALCNISGTLTRVLNKIKELENGE